VDGGRAVHVPTRVGGAHLGLVRAGPESRVLRGEVQEAKAAPSSPHSKVAPVSLAENVNVALVLVVVAGGLSPIVVSGAVVSTVIARLAGLVSVLPAASMARTSKVWAPSARAAVVRGDVQAAKAPVVTRHWKLAPGSLEKPYVGVESLVSPLGRNASDGTVRRPRRDGRGGEGPRRER
jgi:hypothetical protein